MENELAAELILSTTSSQYKTQHAIACYMLELLSNQLSIVASYDTSTHPSTHPSVIDRIDLLRVQLTAYAHLNFKIHHSIAFG